MKRRACALALAVLALPACKDKKSECPGLVAAAKLAHGDVAKAIAGRPGTAMKDQALMARDVSVAAGKGADAMSGARVATTIEALRTVAGDYVAALKDLGEAAHTFQPLAEKSTTLDSSIKNNKLASLVASAKSEADGLAQRCNAKPPPAACAFVMPKLAGLDLATAPPDTVAKLADTLEGASKADPQFEIALYDFRGSLRGVAVSSRGLAQATQEKGAVDRDVAAARTKLDAALAREPLSEGAIESECAN